MYYILTKEEFNNLRTKKDYEALRREIKVLESALKWARDKIARKCIHNHDEDHIMYCDECPLSDVGGRGKEKKRRPSHKISKALCTLDREYSK